MARGQAVHKPTDMESGGRTLVPCAIYDILLWATMKGENVSISLLHIFPKKKDVCLGQTDHVSLLDISPAQHILPTNVF